MSKRTAEMSHVQAVLAKHGARVFTPRTHAKEVTHRYQIDGNFFTYTHGVARGNDPKAVFERDLRRAHRANCRRRGINPAF